MCYITREEKEKLAGRMEQISTSREDFAFFARDAANVRAASAVILLGAYYNPVDLDCGLCGVENCAEKLENENMPCLFNSIDLGIAIGSAVRALKSHCIDNSVMFSAGRAAKELKFMDANIIFAIPMNVSEKSIFLTRKMTCLLQFPPDRAETATMTIPIINNEAEKINGLSDKNTIFALENKIHLLYHGCQKCCF